MAAKAAGNPKYDYFHPELQTIFQGVLADRFKLAIHKTTKELPIYSLVVAKNGPKIYPVDQGACPEAPLPDNPCHMIRQDRFAHITAENASMPALAHVLMGPARRTVVDKTGLNGSYSFTLDWKGYLQAPQRPGVVAPPNSFDPESVEPAIAAALEEQLGIKMEPGKGPVEAIVIDHIERPSEN